MGFVLLAVGGFVMGWGLCELVGNKAPRFHALATILVGAGVNYLGWIVK